MEVNGIDINTGLVGTAKQFKVTKFDKNLTVGGVIAGSIPVPGIDSYWQDVTVDIYVKSGVLDRNVVSGNIAKIISRFSDVVDLTLDNHDMYRGVLTGWSVSGLDKRRAQKLSLKLRGYFYKPFSFEWEGVIRNGVTINVQHPVIVNAKIYGLYSSLVTVDMTGLTPDPMTGDDLPITFKPLSEMFEDEGLEIDTDSGKIWRLYGYEISGEPGIHWERDDYALDEVPIIRSWPMLKPGSNTITAPLGYTVKIVLSGREIL